MSEAIVRIVIDPVHVVIAPEVMNALAAEISAAVALAIGTAVHARIGEIADAATVPAPVCNVSPLDGVDASKVVEILNRAVWPEKQDQSNSGAGEHRGEQEDGVHHAAPIAAAAAPSSDVSSSNLPEAGVPPASFSGEDQGKPGVIWTEGRKAELVRLAEAGAKWADIHAALNVLPGPAIASANAVQVRYSTMKSLGLVPVRRPNVDTAKAAPAEVAMTIPQARQWAAERGLCNGIHATLDMKRVNAKRRSLGLPRIKLEGR